LEKKLTLTEFTQYKNSIKLRTKQNWPQILHRGFYFEDEDIFIELWDGSQRTNHSDDDWNCATTYNQSKSHKDMTVVAVRDIQVGEELTETYSTYMSTKAKWVDDLMVNYNPERKMLEDHIEKKQR